MSFEIKVGTYSFATQAAISDLKVTSALRTTENPVIRSDMTIISDGKFKPMVLALKGTLSGTDYKSFRTKISELYGVVLSTTQSLYIESDRYLRVKSKGLDYSFVKQDFCNFTCNFSAELPYFLAVNASSYIGGVTGDTLGITSGTSFNVSNLGDVQIPCKIVITGAGAATINDNIQFENTTLGTLFKYRGVLQITSSLIIDLGYDYHNVPTYTVTLDGVDAMSAFEGDFMELAYGSNALEYTGAQTGSISIYYRQGYYA